MDHGDACVQSEVREISRYLYVIIIAQDVPYYCPSCDVNVRRAKKAQKQAQAKELKARARLAESHRVKAVPQIIINKGVIAEEIVTDYDNSTSDDDQLVVDTAKNKNKTVKRKHAQSPESQSPERKSSSVITQTLPQLEVRQL